MLWSNPSPPPSYFRGAFNEEKDDVEMADVSTDASASAGSASASATSGAKIRKRGGGVDEETSLNGDDVDAKKKKFDLGETG